MQLEKFYYDNRIVRNFAYATILWGAVGMLAGIFPASRAARMDPVVAIRSK